jgi:PadR family transcriptional regulator, regulatory protein AphA
MIRNASHTGPLSPEFALLGLLEQGSKHGYQLFQILISDLGQVWHISLSQAYNILNRLESRGFIAAEVLPQEKLPDRKLFSLTPAGQERFEHWLSSTSFTSVRAIRLEFLTRLYFAQSRGVEFSHQIINAQLSEVHAGLERLSRAYHDIPDDQLINHLSLDLRSRQLESILVWLENCHRAIDQPSAEHKLQERNS